MRKYNTYHGPLSQKWIDGRYQSLIVNFICYHISEFLFFIRFFCCHCCYCYCYYHSWIYPYIRNNPLFYFCFTHIMYTQMYGRVYFVFMGICIYMCTYNTHIYVYMLLVLFSTLFCFVIFICIFQNPIF